MQGIIDYVRPVSSVNSIPALERGIEHPRYLNYKEEMPMPGRFTISHSIATENMEVIKDLSYKDVKEHLKNLMEHSSIIAIYYNLNDRFYEYVVNRDPNDNIYFVMTAAYTKKPNNLYYFESGNWKRISDRESDVIEHFVNFMNPIVNPKLPAPNIGERINTSFPSVSNTVLQHIENNSYVPPMPQMGGRRRRRSRKSRKHSGFKKRRTSRRYVSK